MSGNEGLMKGPVFSERPEIVVTGGGPGSDYENTGEFSARDIAETKQEFAGLRADEIKHEITSVGAGADAYALALILVGGLASVFFSGTRIEANLDAWTRLATRLADVLKRLRPQRNLYLSEPLAAALALSAVVSDKPKTGNIELLETTVLPIINRSLRDEHQDKFKTNPARYYIFRFLADDSAVHILCVRSTGEVEFHHILRMNDWYSFHSS